MELHEALAAKVDAWLESGYPSDIPALAEMVFADAVVPAPDIVEVADFVDANPSISS